LDGAMLGTASVAAVAAEKARKVVAWTSKVD
jgi:hypothetical protein